MIKIYIIQQGKYKKERLSKPFFLNVNILRVLGCQGSCKIMIVKKLLQLLSFFKKLFTLKKFVIASLSEVVSLTDPSQADNLRVIQADNNDKAGIRDCFVVSNLKMVRRANYLIVTAVLPKYSSMFLARICVGFGYNLMRDLNFFSEMLLKSSSSKFKFAKPRETK
jgi:hypothetical protein